MPSSVANITRFLNINRLLAPKPATATTPLVLRSRITTYPTYPPHRYHRVIVSTRRPKRHLILKTLGLTILATLGTPYAWWHISGAATHLASLKQKWQTRPDSAGVPFCDILDIYRTLYSFSPTLSAELEAMQQLHGDELDVVIASHFQRLGFVLGLYSMFLSLGEHQWRRVHTAAMQLRSQGKSFYELYAKELSVMPLWIRFSPFLPALQALERQIVEETTVPVKAMEQVMTLVKPNQEPKWARRPSEMLEAVRVTLAAAGWVEGRRRVRIALKRVAGMMEGEWERVEEWTPRGRVVVEVPDVGRCGCDWCRVTDWTLLAALARRVWGLRAEKMEERFLAMVEHEMWMRKGSRVKGVGNAGFKLE